MNRKTNAFFWVPNLITTMNIICGSMAVFFGIGGLLGWAAIFILLAAVFDFFDGFSARLLHAYSDLGKELDSLADVISFGLAPATMVFSMIQLTLFGRVQPIGDIVASPSQWILMFTSLMIPIAGAFRLAKFNTDTRQTESFLGLAIPANAFVFASLGLIVELGSSEQIISFILNKHTLLLTVFACSVLMVSEVPMFALKFKNLKLKENRTRFIFLSGIVVLLIGLKLYALPLIIVWYVLMSIIDNFFLKSE